MLVSRRLDAPRFSVRSLEAGRRLDAPGFIPGLLMAGLAWDLSRPSPGSVSRLSAPYWAEARGRLRVPARGCRLDAD